MQREARRNERQTSQRVVRATRSVGSRRASRLVVVGSVLAIAVLACNGDIRLGGASAVDQDAGPTPDGNVTKPPSGTCGPGVDCALAALHCDVATSACVECTTDAHCTHPGRTKCDSLAHRCVECELDADCGPGKLCEPTARKCIDRCNATTPCPASAPTCDVTRGVCVTCTVDSTCDPSVPHCEHASGRCVACTTDAHCSAPRGRCDVVLGRCVGCLSNTQCGAQGSCDVAQGECVSQQQQD